VKLLRSNRIAVSTFALSLLVVSGLVALRAYRHSSTYGLPYHDSFTRGSADEWKAIGGTWELAGGTMRNDSDERGAKLIAGSPYWKNYSVDADVYLLGISGDAGLIIRSGNEEEGVNSYSGYYAGIRTLDNVLVLGRAEHSWLEATNQIRVFGGVHPFQWYHLKLLAYDCQIAVALTSAVQPGRTAFGVKDSDCLRSGRIGLRSYSAGGIWRNIVVRSTTEQDLRNLLQGADIRDTNSGKDAVIEDSESIRERQLQQEEQALASSDPQTLSIGSLRLTSFAAPTTATVRGVVILAAQRLYVEDSTGGVYVKAVHTPLLKVGDEVEVKGESHPSDFSSTLEKAAVRVLWARTPVPPVSVTASQAATGKFDATFIEVRGRLRSKQRGPGNTLLLDLDEGSQSFRAIMNSGRSDLRFNQLKPDSVLRLRGICVADAALTNSLTPFVLLLRSNEDLDLISGPPWWTTGHIVALIVVVLLLALLVVSLYHRIENWRLRSILEERERLAHEMHDTLAQSFAGIGFQLQAIRNGVTEEMPTVRQQLDLACNLVRHSHEEARRSISTLRTEDFRAGDVLNALDSRARRMVGGGAVQIVSERKGDSRALPIRVTDALFRIGQEAIANSIRHALPRVITIRLTQSAEMVRLEVEDDGVGFSQTKGQLGFGIRGMRRRAHAVAATFQIRSSPGAGTRIRIDAPVPPRVTLLSWIKTALAKMMEHRIHGRATAHTNPHTYS
jgi:signal transduction histidine kinase